MKNLYLFLFLPALTFASGVPDGKTETDAKDGVQQEPDHQYKPLTLKISEDGSKYVRFILWHQIWVTSNNLANEDNNTQFSASIRRSRFLAYAQISPKFLILTHWGLNGLGTNNLSSLGSNSDAPQLFLHGAWTEFKLSKQEQVYVGGGLHYWKGLTRLASQSTLNFMTMDNTRPFVHWHSLGITDQFARHLGIYAKGKLGKFDYRMALNNPMNPANAIGAGQDFAGLSNLTYTGSSQLEGEDPVGNTIIEGYFKYNFFDSESIKLPYAVGTYLGGKKILAVGLGFFSHANAMYNTVTGEHGNVFHLAGDVFLDMPIGDAGNAINAYASVINFDYGENYMSRWAGTGTNLYGQFGYYLKSLNMMPYLAYQTGSYDAFADNLTAFDIGANYYVNSHHAKITLEYHNISNNPLEGGTDTDGAPIGTSQLRMQLHIFL